MAVPEASASTVNGIIKSGVANIEAFVMALFSWSKAH